MIKLNTKLLKIANFREKGLRRWDIVDEKIDDLENSAANINLFYSRHEDWYNGPNLYIGWTLHLWWNSNGKQLWYVFKVDKEVAHDLLSAKFH
jgi:uncharacterized protein (DUF2126 family)